MTLSPDGLRGTANLAAERQALRIRRSLMASGASVLVMALLVIAYLFEGLERTGLVRGTLLITFWIVFFNVLLRTGWNMKFRDPSLTAPQFCAAIVTMTYVMYYADRSRGGMLIVFMMVFLFGVFRLRTKQLFMLAVMTLLMYAAMVACVYHYKPASFEVYDEVVALIVLTMVLPWFAWMGGNVSKLRDDMRIANRDLDTALDRLRERASRDDLTGVNSRRRLLDLLAQEKSRCDRGDVPFTVTILDIDHFKAVNDNHGHLVGDEVLKVVARTLGAQLRDLDHLGRYGGEEFVVIFTHTTQHVAAIAVERMRAAVASRIIPQTGGQPVTISLGVTQYRRGESIEQLLARADAALYRAKNSGRNQAEYAPATG